MKLVIMTLIVSFISILNAHSQTSPNYVNGDKGFELSYPDSLSPVTLNDNEDIKEQVEPFVIQIYDLNQSPMADMSDECYHFNKIFKSKSGLSFKKYSCSEGAAGKTYKNYIYVVEKGSWNLVLKFLHAHSNVEGNTFNEEKDTYWITKILESVKFTK